MKAFKAIHKFASQNEFKKFVAAWNCFEEGELFSVTQNK